VDCLLKSDKHDFCEFKGETSYYNLKVGEKQANNAAWYYPNPTKEYSAIKDHVREIKELFQIKPLITME
jgi:uncharacterized protein (DUF427 family)